MTSGPGFDVTASRAAWTSIRWFVVAAAAPLAYRPPGTAHAQPPGPGFPTQAPSVYTSVASTGLITASGNSRCRLGVGFRGVRDWNGDLRRLQPAAPRHRSPGDGRVGRLPGDG